MKPYRSDRAEAPKRSSLESRITHTYDSSPMAAEETRDSPAAGVVPVLIPVAGP